VGRNVCKCFETFNETRAIVNGKCKTPVCPRT